MKRLLALLLACLLLVLNACGTPTEDAANTEPSELTAEELPESCRRWFDIAASSGTAEPDSQLPFAEKGHDCTIDGGGEPCFNGFDCVLITGDGTLTFTTMGIRCGGDRFDLPALMVAGDVTVVCPDMELLSNGNAPAYTQLGGTVYTDWMQVNGEVLVADGLLLARQLLEAKVCTFRGGVALIDEYNVDSAAAIVMSGGQAYFNGELPKESTIEGGAGTLAAANLASVTANSYNATLLDNEQDGGAYYQTAFSEEWAPVDGESVMWDGLCAAQVEPLCWFGGTMKLNGAALEDLLPWGALHLELTGSNAISGELGGTSLLFTGDGSLSVSKLSIWAGAL